MNNEKQFIMAIIRLFQLLQLKGSIARAFPFGIIPENLLGMSEQDTNELYDNLCIVAAASESRMMLAMLENWLAAATTKGTLYEPFFKPPENQYLPAKQFSDRVSWPLQELFIIDNPEVKRILNKQLSWKDMREYMREFLDKDYLKLLSACEEILKLYFHSVNNTISFADARYVYYARSREGNR